MMGIIVLFAFFGFAGRAALGPDVSIVMPTSLPTSRPWALLTAGVPPSRTETRGDTGGLGENQIED